MTADIGLDFDVYCDVKISGSDISESVLPDLEACLQQCAIKTSTPSERCMAIEWNVSSRRCYLKTSNATISNLKPSDGSIFAFADTAAFENRPTGCPYDNGTIQVSQSGMQYRISCGTDHNTDDFDYTNPETEYKPFHADTMLECMNFCSDHDPLCYGVTYTERMDYSYRNCYPKTVNLTSKQADFIYNDLSTLAIGLLPDPNTTCSGDTYQSAKGVTFETQCDQRGDGPNLNRTHTDTLEDCVEACVDFVPESGDGKCATVTFEPASRTGFLNCHLKSYNTNITANSNWRVATVSDSSNSSDSSVPALDTSTSDHGATPPASKAWIAGPAVGGVAGVALLAWFVFWWQRRKASKARDALNRGRLVDPKEFNDSHEPTLANSNAQQWASYHDKAHSRSTSVKVLHEMGSEGSHATELPGSEEQRSELSDARRAELP